MGRSRPILVLGQDGLRGTLVEGQSVRSGEPHVLIELENGQRLFVPTEALVVQKDGNYRLSLGRSEIERLGAQARSAEEIVLPVVEEELDVQKRVIETGGVRVRKVVHEHEEAVEMPLMREEVDVERVPVNRVVEGDVAIRYEGETMIIPVVEEVLVVEKRMMLKEELRVTRKRHTRNEARRFNLRSEEAIVERLPGGPAGETSAAGTVETSELQNKRASS